MTVVVFTDALIRDGLLVPSGKRKGEWTDGIVRCLTFERRATSPQGGTWSYRPKVAGTRSYHRLGSVSELNVAEARRKALLIAGDVPTRNSGPMQLPVLPRLAPTLDVYWADSFHPYILPRKRSASKDESLYRLYLKEKFGNVRLTDLKRQELQTYHAELLKRGLSPASADHVLKLLRSMLNRAVEWEIVERNPIEKVEHFNFPNGRERFLNQDELQRLLLVLQKRKDPVFLLLVRWLLATGCRLGSATGATHGQVDRPNKLWRIPPTHTKNGKGQVLPLNLSAMSVLEQIGVGGADEHLFVSMKTGKPLAYVHSFWDGIRKEADLDGLRIHDLRHSHVSSLIQGGVSLYSAQLLAGHSTSATVQRYAHMSMDALASASRAASGVIEQAMASIAQTPQ